MTFFNLMKLRRFHFSWPYFTIHSFSIALISIKRLLVSYSLSQLTLGDLSHCQGQTPVICQGQTPVICDPNQSIIENADIATLYLTFARGPRVEKLLWAHGRSIVWNVMAWLPLLHYAFVNRVIFRFSLWVKMHNTNTAGTICRKKNFVRLPKVDQCGILDRQTCLRRHAQSTSIRFFLHIFRVVLDFAVLQGHSAEFPKEK